MNDVPFVRTEHLGKTYPDGLVNALVDVNLTIRKGEYVAVMGPSGCGKSTLLNLLGALDLPTSGSVSYEGVSLGSMRDLDGFRARKLGFVFQSFYLLPTLSAVENVQVPMFESAISAGQRAKKARELLETMGLTDRADRLPSQLSVGQRQRVAIARALANDPVLLLADEPTGNLDSKTAAEVLDIFERLHRERAMTTVMVTHGSEVADRASRRISLRDGRVVEDSAI
jgi:putative ABC transport system ATP-binding protein